MGYDLHITRASDWTDDVVQPCDRVEVRLTVENDVVAKGLAPAFRLSVRNGSGPAVRLLDTREGRRRDLGDNYYSLVVLGANGKQPEVPIAISDPGPMSDTDFLTLLPGQQIQLPVTTRLALDRLGRGTYRAHVVIHPEAYSGPTCASSSVRFRVR